jgi:hypothetical protein
MFFLFAQDKLQPDPWASGKQFCIARGTLKNPHKKYFTLKGISMILVNFS